MTARDRLKQLVAAASIVAAVSSCTVLLLVRCERTATFFGGGAVLGGSALPLFGRGPVNDGCPRRDHATKKDLTIHFSFVPPMKSQFDGWLQIRDTPDGRSAVLYRGPYRQTITIRGLCYDEARPGGDLLGMTFDLETKHHSYSVYMSDKLPLGSYSEVGVVFGPGYYTQRPTAGLQLIR